MNMIIKFVIGMICFLFAQDDFADWIGPSEALYGTWGSAVGQFRFVHGDPTDGFPTKIMIDKNNNIIVQDLFNKRVQVFKLNGKITAFSFKELNPGWEIMQWPSDIPSATGFYNNIFVEGGFGKFQFYDYQGNIINQYKVEDCILKQVNEDGSLILMNYKNERYYRYSPTGQFLKTYDDRPLELGLVKEDSTQNNITKLIMEYPEKKYLVEIREYSPEDKISRDILENLYVIQRRVKIINKNTDEKDYIQHYIVNRIDNCSNVQILLDMPENKHEVVGYDPSVGKRKKALELYGEPVISPNGDVYTWKYTPEKYSILKWTWQGPEDAPQSLQISAGVAGLKLNWQKPIKDVETVSGYQILRSSEVCGPFNEVTTVKKDKLSFEDTTIKPPWKYYYVVKAVRDKKFSDESNKVYMQWK